jgi:hypothetical protein
MNRTLLIACCLAVPLNCLGCGGARDYPGEQRFALTGKVTASGEPIGMGIISFLPQGKEGRVSGGEIKEGIYSIPEPKGPTAGTYRVEIRWTKLTGKKSPDPLDPTIMIEHVAEGLPDKYHKNSTLTADVGPEKTTFDFNLEAKK